MITADNLKYFATLNIKHLEAIALNSGYKGIKLAAAEFLGLTNGGEFCYKIAFAEEGQRHQGKVFVKYNPTEDRATLDF